MKEQKQTRIATDKIYHSTFGGCKKRQFHNIIVDQLQDVSLCMMLINTECSGEVS